MHDEQITAGGVRARREDATASVTFARADRHNAVTPELDAALADERRLFQQLIGSPATEAGNASFIGRRSRKRVESEPPP